MARGESYEEFVEKFKPKKTTDDCYTPEPIYGAVLDWVVEEYGIDREKVIRPFWPGADYQAKEYPAGYTVVDNPPFSIVTSIVRWFNEHGIKYFLFSPHLTCFNIRGACKIVTDSRVTYKNGAQVPTAFVTNLEDCECRTAPKLRAALAKADKERLRKKKQPKYVYPAQVLTAAMLGKIAQADFRVSKGVFIHRLDSQKEARKSIFGGGLLLSEKAAAEKAAAEKAAAEKAAAETKKKWELSDRERALIEGLGHTAHTIG